MEVIEITNHENFFERNIDKLYLLSMSGYRYSEYEEQLKECELIKEYFNINEIFILRTKNNYEIICYILYSSLCFKLKIFNEIIINVHNIDPNILLILTQKNKYFFNIKENKYDVLEKTIDDYSLINFFVNSYEKIIDGCDFSHNSNYIKIETMDLEPFENNDKYINKILCKNLLSSDKKFLICRYLNNNFIYDIVDRDNNKIMSFKNIIELISFLNNKFFYLLHVLIR